MPARNAQNPIKVAKETGRAGPLLNDPAKGQAKSGSGGGRCPACGADVPPKPGFRFSSLKCPQCGVSMGKK